MTDGCNGNVRALDQRIFLVKWGRRAAGLVLLLLLGCAALRGYAAWRKQHLAQQTIDFVARGDFRNAVLVARRLLELENNNLVAARAMAEMAEKSGRAEAIEWRQRIAFADATPTSQVALARTALRFGQRELAEAVLKALPESARTTVEYHQLAAAEALARKDAADAEEHFAAALELAPDDARLAYDLAALRLASPNAASVDQARVALVRLTERTAMRTDALRALAAHALALGRRDEAIEWSTALKAEPQPTFSDALLCFQALAGTDTAAAALRELQAKAATSPTAAAELIAWMNRHEMAPVAFQWSTALPSDIRETHPVLLATAESYSFLRDWDGLRRFVEGKKWGRWESLRLAVYAHALRHMSHSDRASMECDAAWRSALKAAQGQPDQLFTIAQLAEGWGYADEAETAWWQLASGTENARSALLALQSRYQAKRDTRGLLRVARRALELNPDDLVAANNCASLGLLTAPDTSARRLALRLHAEHPAQAAFSATFAYALHTEGKRTEALRVLEELKEETLRQPAIAAYYVIMLTESGKLERARSFLVEAKRATLLPEEQQLLDAAAAKLLSESAAKVAKNL